MTRECFAGAWMLLLVGCTSTAGGAAPAQDSGATRAATSAAGHPAVEAGLLDAQEGDSGFSGPRCAATLTTLVPPFWTEADAFVEQVGDVAVTKTDVYFTLFMPSSLWRVPIRGGQPTRLFPITGEEDQMIATSKSVVLAESHVNADARVDGEIVLLSGADGSASTLAATKGRTMSLVVDETDIYFVDDEGTKTVPLTGGSVRVLTSQSGTLGRVGASLLLIADGSAGKILSIPTAGGALTTLATNQPGAGYPVSCGADICWMTARACVGPPPGTACVTGQGALVRMQPGGAPVTLAQDSLLYAPAGLVFDGHDFFVTSAQDASFSARVVRVPATGGTPIVIGSANSLVVADGCLYATNFLNGVYSVASSYTPSP